MRPPRSPGFGGETVSELDTLKRERRRERRAHEADPFETSTSGCCLSCLSACCGAAFVLVGVLMPTIVDFVIDARVRRTIVLSSSTENIDVYEAWRATRADDPLAYEEVYLFDILNAAEVLANRTRPRVAERGPFVVRRARRKFGVTFDDARGEVKFSEWQQSQFMPERSAGSLDDSITAVSLPYIVLMRNLDVGRARRTVLGARREEIIEAAFTLRVLHRSVATLASSGARWNMLLDPSDEFCRGVDCGLHGECVGLGYCKCADGFTGDSCNDPPDPCATVDCGRYGRCSATNWSVTSAMCTCHGKRRGPRCEVPPLTATAFGTVPGQAGYGCRSYGGAFTDTYYRTTDGCRGCCMLICGAESPNFSQRQCMTYSGIISKTAATPNGCDCEDQCNVAICGPGKSGKMAYACRNNGTCTCPTGLSGRWCDRCAVGNHGHTCLTKIVVASQPSKFVTLSPAQTQAVNDTLNDGTGENLLLFLAAGRSWGGLNLGSDALKCVCTSISCRICTPARASCSNVSAGTSCGAGTRSGAQILSAATPAATVWAEFLANMSLSSQEGSVLLKYMNFHGSNEIRELTAAGDGPISKRTVRDVLGGYTSAYQTALCPYWCLNLERKEFAKQPYFGVLRHNHTGRADALTRGALPSVYETGRRVIDDARRVIQFQGVRDLSDIWGAGTLNVSGTDPLLGGIQPRLSAEAGPGEEPLPKADVVEQTLWSEPLLRPTLWAYSERQATRGIDCLKFRMQRANWLRSSSGARPGVRRDGLVEIAALGAPGLTLSMPYAFADNSMGFTYARPRHDPAAAAAPQPWEGLASEFLAEPVTGFFMNYTLQVQLNAELEPFSFRAWRDVSAEKTNSMIPVGWTRYGGAVSDEDKDAFKVKYYDFMAWSRTVLFVCLAFGVLWLAVSGCCLVTVCTKESVLVDPGAPVATAGWATAIPQERGW